MHVGDSGGGRRRGRGRHRGNEEVALQITSMADIFTILLVFLLKSYAVSAVNVNVSKDMKLPIARGGTDQIEALKVEVGEKGVTVEGESVANFTNYEPNSGELSRDGNIVGLVKALRKERDKQRQLAAANPSEKKELDSKLLVIADKKVPYKTLKLVLSSATVEDYTDFKLVVVSED